MEWNNLRAHVGWTEIKCSKDGLENCGGGCSAACPGSKVNPKRTSRAAVGKQECGRSWETWLEWLLNNKTNQFPLCSFFPILCLSTILPIDAPLRAWIRVQTAWRWSSYRAFLQKLCQEHVYYLPLPIESLFFLYLPINASILQYKTTDNGDEIVIDDVSCQDHDDFVHVNVVETESPSNPLWF